MTRKTEIKQNEMAVVEVVTGKEVISTPGVSTCICISVKGQYGTHPFIALFHWEGLDARFDKKAPGAEERARDAINTFYIGH
jgi:hypothetical protein